MRGIEPVIRVLSVTELAKVNNRHTYHKPTDRTAKNHQAVRDILLKAELDVLSLIPEGRGASLFQTKMDEARMWANQSIATDPTFDPGTPPADPVVTAADPSKVKPDPKVDPKTDKKS